MSGSEMWRQLCVCEGPAEARAIATSVAAMEYDVRVGGLESVSGAPKGEGGPVVIECRVEDWPDLVSVLDQIIEEQEEFDAHLEHRDRRVLRAQHVMLGVLIVVVIALALLGLNGL